jgi:uncharacterized membrane protein
MIVKRFWYNSIWRAYALLCSAAQHLIKQPMRIIDPMHILSRSKYKLALTALLVAASLLSIIIEFAHARINGQRLYSNLVFNLGLAWIPFAAAVLAYLTRRNRVTFFLILPFSALVWLVFFPNAPYLLTDFQHLAGAEGRAPLWLDVLVMIWFAWTGLLLGIASLYLIHEIVTEIFNPTIGWVFAIGATVLSGIGVYLGRFLRWNSWDLLYDPIPIARDMFALVRNPISNLPSYVFTILFTLLFLFIYVTFFLFAGMLKERGR